MTASSRTNAQHGLRFPLGRILATPGALAALSEANAAPIAYLKRHASGDWGDVCDQDRKENELSVEKGYRILSSYRLPTQEKLWIITEADRSATTLLLPDEY